MLSGITKNFDEYREEWRAMGYEWQLVGPARNPESFQSPAGDLIMVIEQRVKLVKLDEPVQETRPHGKTGQYPPQVDHSPFLPQPEQIENGLGHPVEKIDCATCGNPARTDHAMSSFMRVHGKIRYGFCSPVCETEYHRVWRQNLVYGVWHDGEGRKPLTGFYAKV